MAKASKGKETAKPAAKAAPKAASKKAAAKPAPKAAAKAAPAKAAKAKAAKSAAPKGAPSPAAELHLNEHVAALPGLGAAKPAQGGPGVRAPAKDDPLSAVPKGPAPKLGPKGGFDPRAEDWRRGGHSRGQVGGGPPSARPFKGGGRGR